MRLAAIDIGSNAARLLICDVIETDKSNPQFIKLNLVRVPLRLGFDVFEPCAVTDVQFAVAFEQKPGTDVIVGAAKLPPQPAVVANELIAP